MPASITKKKKEPQPVVELQFEHPLVLTSPHMKGIDVRDCQWLLSGNNDILHPVTKQSLRTYTGRIDKDYGPTTAGAVKEAKWELGYPLAAVTNQFGQEIYEYLIGRQTLPAPYLTRRKDRLAVPIKQKILEFAITQIPYKEQRDWRSGNINKYGKWYGWDRVPWCAIFCSFCITEVSGILWKYAYVPTIVELARQGQAYLSITHNPEPGDLVAYWNGREYHHIEFYEKENDDNSFFAIGGNTSPTNFSNGGQVARMDRLYSTVGVFMRLSLPTPKEI